MAEMKTNTRKRDYHIMITLEGKTIDTFKAHTDSVLNALKSAYEQCCGYRSVTRELIGELDKWDQNN